MTENLETEIVPGPGGHNSGEIAMARKTGFQPSAETTGQGLGEPARLARVVGVNLKRLRRRQGYSLERLAKLSGVSRAMLGQIETGRSVPTIGLLSKIAEALDVSIPSLLTSQDSVATQVLRSDKTRAVIASDGRFVARALFPYGGEQRVEFYEVTLAPGHRELDEPHAPGTRENLVVVEGSVDVQVGREKPVGLQAGDALLFAADQPHGYRNTGNEPARLYLVLIHASNGT